MNHPAIMTQGAVSTQKVNLNRPFLVFLVFSYQWHTFVTAMSKVTGRQTLWKHGRETQQLQDASGPSGCGIWQRPPTQSLTCGNFHSNNPERHLYSWINYVCMETSCLNIQVCKRMETKKKKDPGSSSLCIAHKELVLLTIFPACKVSAPWMLHSKSPLVSWELVLYLVGLSNHQENRPIANCSAPPVTLYIRQCFEPRWHICALVSINHTEIHNKQVPGPYIWMTQIFHRGIRCLSKVPWVSKCSNLRQEEVPILR